MLRISNPPQILNAFSPNHCTIKAPATAAVAAFCRVCCFPSFFALVLCLHFCDTVNTEYRTWFTAQCKQRILLNIWRFFFFPRFLSNNRLSPFLYVHFIFAIYKHTCTATWMGEFNVWYAQCSHLYMNINIVSNKMNWTAVGKKRADNKNQSGQ